MAVGAALTRLGARTRRQALCVAVALFAAFPAVLLAGSVIHGESSAGLAAIHAGDWLIKLTIAALILRRTVRPSSSTANVGPATVAEDDDAHFSRPTTFAPA